MSDFLPTIAVIVVALLLYAVLRQGSDDAEADGPPQEAGRRAGTLPVPTGGDERLTREATPGQGPSEDVTTSRKGGKGRSRCPACGTGITADDERCPSCGINFIADGSLRWGLGGGGPADGITTSPTDISE
jgi:hypothetical protein